MPREEMLNKAKDVLTPFETDNLITFMKNLSVLTFIDHPWLIAVFVIILFYAVVKRSKFLLLFLFALFSIVALIRYTFPEGQDMTMASFIPFVGGGLLIGAIIVYFAFVRSD